jgi:hypothetical protein
MKLALLKPDPSDHQRRPCIYHQLLLTLCVGDDGITSPTALSKVVSLEITAQFVESKSLEQVVVHVASVEQLSHHKVDILLWS